MAYVHRVAQASYVWREYAPRVARVAVDGDNIASALSPLAVLFIGSQCGKPELRV